jgi:hypothetical protein
MKYMFLLTGLGIAGSLFVVYFVWTKLGKQGVHIDGTVDIPGGGAYTGNRDTYRQYGLDSFAQYEELEEGLYYKRSDIVEKYFPNMSDAHKYAFLKHFITKHTTRAHDGSHNELLDAAIAQVQNESHRAHLQKEESKK